MEDNALLAITMRDSFINTMFYEGERDEEQIRAPFLFTFQRIEDMEVFLQEIRDKRDPTLADWGIALSLRLSG